MLDEIRRGLARELETDTYVALFKSFARRCRCARRFGGWLDLIAYQHGEAARKACGELSRAVGSDKGPDDAARKVGSDKGPDDAARDSEDGILCELFTCYAENRSPLWLTVLTLVFFPVLTANLVTRRHWRTCKEEMCSDLYWALTGALADVDPSSRQSEIVRQVINRTLGRFRQLCEKEWNHARRERASADLVHTAKEPNGPDLRLVALEERDEARWVLGRLRGMAERSAISREDLKLVLDTRMQEVNLQDAATARGLTYQAAKKRRQRAETAIRNLMPGAPGGNGHGLSPPSRQVRQVRRTTEAG